MLDLSSIYAHLEENATQYKYLHDISKLFQSVRDEMHRQQKTEEETKAQWEIDVFNFLIEEDVAKPMFTMTNSEGKEIVYPDYNNFTDLTYDYIIGRLSLTRNPLLKARYAHILWLSPKKKLTYADIAIDAYLELIPIYEQKDKEQPTEHYGLDILNAVKNAVVISLKIRDTKRIETLKTETKRLIFDFNPKSSSLFVLRANLAKLMLEKKTMFSKDDFVGLNELFYDFAKGFSDNHQAITIYTLGEKIDQKIGVTTHDWKLLVAQTYESMMQAHLKEKLVAITFCTSALKYYRELKNAKKVTELEKTYAELKDSAELKEYKIDLNLEEHIEKCKQSAKKIAQCSTNDILQFLSTTKQLYPKSQDMRKITEDLLKEHALLGIFPTQIMDERGHTVQHFVSPDEILFFRTLTQYQLYLENHYMPLLHEIIVEAIEEKKISFSLLMNYFAENSWYGETLEKKNQNETVKYNWLNLIAPPLLEYFTQIDFFFSSRNYPNFVLCIDSLTLKIEGLIRDLCTFSGMTTFYQNTDKQGLAIFMERDLNALLHDDKITQLFDEDDLLFLKFILVEKAGYNLRHNIAHSLMNFNEYQIKYAHLLVFLTLRLSKFKLTQKEETKSE